MELFHGTNDNKLTISETTGKIDGWNLFFGMFFSDDKDIAESHGDTIFKTEVAEEDIVKASKLPWISEVIDIVKELYSVSNDELSDFIDYIAGDKNIYSNDDIEIDRLAEILNVSDDGIFGLTGLVSWELQNATGCIAEKLGYRAVEIYDEHGTSYLVLPGNKIERED